MDQPRKTRRRFSKEFKADTVALRRGSGKSVPQVCRDLDLTESVVRRWLAQADVDAGRREGLTTAEREALTSLCKENRVVREERDILKKSSSLVCSRDDDVSRFWFITAEKANASIVRLCRVLWVDQRLLRLATASTEPTRPQRCRIARAHP